jgi:hypothetical protein
MDGSQITFRSAARARGNRHRGCAHDRRRRAGLRHGQAQGGAASRRGDSCWLPDNDQIEEEIREYQSLFQGDSQPALLRRLRLIAVDWMERLAPFNPYLTGAVLGGTAGEHSDVHLQVFCDNPKEVAIYFLNANIQYDVSETRHFAGRGYVETLSFLWRPQNEGRDAESAGIHVALYETDDLRGAVRADARGRTARANLQAVRALLNGGEVTPSTN